MTKAEIVEIVAAQTGLSKSDVLSVIEASHDVIKTQVEKGEQVTFRGFGTYQPKHRAEKIARNIGQNSKILVPAHYVPSFKASKEFIADVRKRLKSNQIINPNKRIK